MGAHSVLLVQPGLPHPLPLRGVHVSCLQACLFIPDVTVSHGAGFELWGCSAWVGNSVTSQLCDRGPFPHRSVCLLSHL